MRVLWSVKARADLRDIVAYVRAENPPAARRLGIRIEHAAAELGTFSIGRHGRVDGTFEKVLAPLPYIITYRVVRATDGKEFIGVVRVIHAARDWPEGGWPADG